MSLNVRIKALRQNLHLTQRVFGEKIGVQNNTVTCYENGVRTPDNSKLELICRVFNVNKDWLLTGEGDMFAPEKQEPEDPVDLLMEAYQLEPEARPLIDTLVGMDKTERKIVLDVMCRLVDNYRNAQAGKALGKAQETVKLPETADAPVLPPESPVAESAAKPEDIRRMFDEQMAAYEKAGEKSLA